MHLLDRGVCNVLCCGNNISRGRESGWNCSLLGKEVCAWLQRARVIEMEHRSALALLHTTRGGRKVRHRRFSIRACGSRRYTHRLWTKVLKTWKLPGRAAFSVHFPPYFWRCQLEQPGLPRSLPSPSPPALRDPRTKKPRICSFHSRNVTS